MGLPTAGHDLATEPQQQQEQHGGSAVKNLPEIQEVQVWSLSLDYPLEKDMANHSSILAWEITRTEDPEGLQSVESQKSHTWFSN